MKRFQILLSKKEYVLLIVEAASKEKAISKAFNDEYIKVIHDPDKLPESDYKVEKIIKEKNLQDEKI